MTRSSAAATPRRRWLAVRRTAAVLIVLLMLGGGAFAAWWYLVREDETAATDPSACPSPTGTPAPTTTPTPSAPTFLPGTPLPPEEVRVTVYNATDRTGLAAAVTEELLRRGFMVGEPANDPLERKITAPAEVRFGPAGAGAALSVAAQVAGAVPAIDDRTDATVVLVLGEGYQALRTPAEAVAAATEVPSTMPTAAAC